jgi:putative transposase
MAQRKSKRELYEKYVRRERNREKDFINKPSSGLRMLFQNTVHVFEDLDKEDLVSRKRAKNRRKRNARTPWRRNAPDAGMLRRETQEGQIFECPRCGLKMNRHKAASINIRRRYLEGKRRGKRKTRMRGFPHSNEPEETMMVELWVGVTPSGWSPAIWIPVKWDPEGFEAKGRGLGIKTYQAQ